MLTEINNLLEGNGITVHELRENTPACEKYILTRFLQDEDSYIETMVPYVYRRSGLWLETAEEIAHHLLSLKQYFSKEYISRWCLQRMNEISLQNTIYAEYLRIFLGSNCKEITQDRFPQNKIPPIIIKRIKDSGFVLSILPGRVNENGRLFRYWLLPIPLTVGATHETMS